MADPERPSATWHAFLPLLPPAFLGAVAFWIPSVVIHRLRGDKFDSSDVTILTLSAMVLICAFALVVQLLTRPDGPVRYRVHLATGVLLWLFGPAFMAMGGGLEWDWNFILVATVFSPLFTWMLSGYDGSLFALILATGILAFLHFRSYAGFRRLQLR